MQVKRSTFYCLSRMRFLPLMLAPAFLPGQQNIDLSDSLSTAISIWEKNAKIAIAPEGRTMVHGDFLEYQGLLRDSVTFSNSTDSEKIDFINAIVAHYLYDVRDAKIRSQPGNAEVDPGRRRVLARGPADTRVILLSAQAKQTAIEIAKLSLEDIKRFSVASFINRIRSLFTRQGGYLEVSSSPKGADIYIDNEHKGFTMRLFFASVGEHPTAVVLTDFKLECRDKVTIEDRKKAYFKCPM